MRAKIWAMSLLVAALTLSGAAPTTASSLSPSVYGVYSDRDAFENAVKLVDAQAKTVPVLMSEEAKQARRQAIARELDQVSPMDVQGQEKVAKKYGLVIYNPNITDVTTFSYEGDVSIYRPTVQYDSMLRERGYLGRTVWNNWQAIWGDTPIIGSNIGGTDAHGLVFTNFPTNDRHYITSWWLQTYDSNGSPQIYNGSKQAISDNGTNFAVMFSFQDKWLGTDRGHCTCWSMSTWVWVSDNFTGHGSVQTAYAHDWNTTKLVAFGWNLSGSADTDDKKTIDSGLQFTWNRTVEKWATDSYYLSY